MGFVGQKIKISNARIGDYSGIGWNERMNECLGKVGVIEEIYYDCIRVRFYNKEIWSIRYEDVVCEVAK